MQDNAAQAPPVLPLAERPICRASGCENKLYRDNRSGFCGAHRSLKGRPDQRLCAIEECDRKLHPRSTTGFCPEHAARYSPAALARRASNLAEKAARDARRQVCTADGCTKLLNFDNRSGRCYTHKWIPVQDSERERCPVEGCGRRLSPKNVLGRCQKHSLPRWVATECAAEGCTKKLNANNLTGLCGQHADHHPRDRRLQRSYGITEAEHDAMLAEQEGACFLCGNVPKEGAKLSASRLHVDHDHETGVVRKLLCLTCNHGLGNFYDNPALLRAAADYIEAFRRTAAA